jgi:hypothetical protein
MLLTTHAEKLDFVLPDGGEKIYASQKKGNRYSLLILGTQMTKGSVVHSILVGVSSLPPWMNCKPATFLALKYSLGSAKRKKLLKPETKYFDKHTESDFSAAGSIGLSQFWKNREMLLSSETKDLKLN